MFCKYCGKEIYDNVKFCPFCGKAIAQIDKTEEEDTAVERKIEQYVVARNQKKKRIVLIISAIIAIVLIPIIVIKVNGYRYISVVKDGFYDESKYSVGDSFEYYFAEPEWNYKTTDGFGGNKDVVEFKGKYYEEGQYKSITIWYVVDDISTGLVHLDGGIIDGKMVRDEIVEIVSMVIGMRE